MSSLCRSIVDALYHVLSLQWWTDAVRGVSQRLKHRVLDSAHPLPRLVEVHVGNEHRVSAMIMAEMVESVRDHLDTVLLITDSTEGNEVSTEVDDTVRVTGVVSAVKYLGRLARSYPTTPTNALIVDGSIETMQRFLAIVVEWDEEDSIEVESLQPLLREWMDTLESRFDPDYVWMEGFTEKTIVDVCWTGIFRWVFENNLFEITHDYPNLACWWRFVRPDYVLLGESSEDEEDDDSGGKEE